MEVSSEDVYTRAANAIKKADFILIGAGAGMGADAGLPLYATMSQREIFKKLGLSYDQIASPTKLVKDPSLFYGFELSSLNLFRDTKPHEGYHILSQWRRSILERFSSQDEKFKKKQMETLINCAPQDLPSSCFVVTSNIDGHFARSGFDSCLRSEEEKTTVWGLGNSNEVANVHGIVYKWQCGGVPSKGESYVLFQRGPCCGDIWDAPSTSDFSVSEFSNFY